MTEKGCAREPPDFELIETYTGRARRMEILADDCCRYIEIIRALCGTRKDIRENCDGAIRSITKVMKRHKAEAAKARGEITQQEYFQTLTERYDEVLAKCIALVDAHKKHWPELVHQCEDTVKRVGEQSRKNSEALTKIADFVNRVTGAQQTKCFPPPLPKDKAEVIPFFLTSSLRTPKIIIEDFSKVQMSCHLA